MFKVGLYIAFEWHVTNCGSVFDMKKLLAVDPKIPVTFDPKKDLVGLWIIFLSAAPTTSSLTGITSTYWPWVRSLATRLARPGCNMSISMTLVSRILLDALAKTVMCTMRSVSPTTARTEGTVAATSASDTMKTLLQSTTRQRRMATQLLRCYRVFHTLVLLTVIRDGGPSVTSTNMSCSTTSSISETATVQLLPAALSLTSSTSRIFATPSGPVTSTPRIPRESTTTCTSSMAGPTKATTVLVSGFMMCDR